MTSAVHLIRGNVARRPEEFGTGVGTGGDDTAALLLWAAALGSGVNGRLDGSYKISGRIALVSLSRFSIVGAGSILIANGTATGEDYSAFLVQDCTDFLLDGFKINGNRAGRTPVESSGHLIRIIGGSRGTLRNLVVENGTTDGIYIRASDSADLATYPTDILLDNVKVSNCYRNNLSIISSVRVTVRGGSYSSANGTAPQAGIGIEANASDTYANTGFKIENPDCSSNTGYGFYTGSGSAGVINADGLVRVSGRDNGGLVDISRSDNIEVISRCFGQSAAPVSSQGVVNIAASASNVSIDAEFTDISASGAGIGCLRVHSGATRITVRRVRGQNITNATPANGFALFVNSSAGCKILRVEGEDITTTSPAVGLLASGTSPHVSSVDLRRCGGRGLYIEAPDAVIEQAYLEDCASTTAALHGISTATSLVVRNTHVHQTSAVPSGAKAVRFDVAPREITRLVGTGGYVVGDLIESAAGLLASTVISGTTPNVLAASVTWTPGGGTLAAGATATTTTNGVSRCSLGDRVHVTPPTNAIAGMIVYAAVTANGTITLTAVNATTASISPVSGVYLVTLIKA